GRWMHRLPRRGRKLSRTAAPATAELRRPNHRQPSPAAPNARPDSPVWSALLRVLQSLAVRPPGLGCLVALFRPPRTPPSPPVRLPCVGTGGKLQSLPNPEGAR